MPPYSLSGQDTRKRRVAWPLFLARQRTAYGRMKPLVKARRRWFRAGVALIAICLVIAATRAPVSAYVVEGPHAVDLMIKALGRGRILQVRQRLRIYDLSMETGERELVETAVYLFPGRYRAEIRSASIQRIHVAADGRSVTIIDDKIASFSVSPLDQYKDLLLCRERSQLLERLTAAGVNTFITSLGRFGDALVVILGARYPDENRPQVWLDKDSYLPLRWIIRPDGHPDGPFEAHFLAWQKVGQQWYPRRIELFENNTMIREIVAEQVLTKADIRPADFDIEALLAKHANPFRNASGDGLPPGNDIEKAIDDFRKRFEQ